MKKYLIIGSLLLAGILPALAGQVGEQEARQKALSFFAKSSTRGVQSSLSRVYIPLTTKSPVWSDNNAPLYVYNQEGGGFVIVSGDDRAVDILGYSATGHIDADRLPENMLSWLQTYARKIEFLDKASLRQVGTRAASTKENIAPKLKACWGQSYPYNLHAPELEVKWGKDTQNLNCLTGCVATAMAMVLYHYKYPKATLRAIPSYSGECDVPVSDGTKTDTVKNVKWVTDSIPANTSIDWSNIVDRYDNKNVHLYDNTEAQKEAVSKLMQYCGTASEMQYGYTGSSAWNGPAVTGLVEVFGYPDIYVVSTMDYVSNQEILPVEDEHFQDWVDVVYNELSKSGPVFFGGYSPSQSGHQFVIDGYKLKDGKDYFYVNWGWDGDDNGYMLLDVLEPGWLLSDSGESEGFTYYQDFIGGMGPNGEAQTKCPFNSLYADELSLGESGKTYKRKSKDESFEVDVFALTTSNPHFPSYTTAIAVGVFDADDNWMTGTLLVDLKEPITFGLEDYVYLDSDEIDGDTTFPIGQGVTDGTYYIRLVTVDPETEEITLMQNAENQTVKMVVDGNKATFDSVIPSAIKTVKTDEKQTVNTPWYSMSGARLSGKPVGKGIYIKDGRKVVVD